MTLKVEYWKLTGTDATNKYVTLSGTPTDGTVALDVISGTAQMSVGSVPDFAVDSTKVKWAGLKLDPAVDLYGGLVTDSEIRVIYDRT
jgi:hypothetical protein